MSGILVNHHGKRSVGETYHTPIGSECGVSHDCSEPIWVTILHLVQIRIEVSRCRIGTSSRVDHAWPYCNIRGTEHDNVSQMGGCGIQLQDYGSTIAPF